MVLLRTLLCPIPLPNAASRCRLWPANELLLLLLLLLLFTLLVSNMRARSGDDGGLGDVACGRRARRPPPPPRPRRCSLADSSPCRCRIDGRVARPLLRTAAFGPRSSDLSPTLISSDDAMCDCGDSVLSISAFWSASGGDDSLPTGGLKLPAADSSESMLFFVVRTERAVLPC
jgi:hypothetical protein